MSTDSLLGVLTAIMGLAGFVVSIHSPKRLVWKICAVSIFATLTAVSVCLVIRQSKQSVATESKLARTLDDLQRSNKEIERVQSLNTDLQHQLIEASDSIRNLAARNVSLAQENIRTVTGGDSYCYIDVASAAQGRGLSIAIHRGNYPLYDVNARLVDLAKMEQFQKSGQKLTLDNVFVNDINIGIGDLPAHTVKTLQQVSFLGAERQSFNIFFSAHNGLWTEALRLRWVDGSWTRAIKMSRLEGNREKIVWTKVDPKYPRHGGSVDWAE